MKKIKNLKVLGDVVVEKPQEKRGIIKYSVPVEGKQSGVLEIITPDLGLVTTDGEAEPWLRFYSNHDFPAFVSDTRLRKTLMGYSKLEVPHRFSFLLGEFNLGKMQFRCHILTRESPDFLIMTIGGKLEEDGVLFKELGGKAQILITEADPVIAAKIVTSIQAYDEKQSERLGSLVEELRKNSRILKDEAIIKKEKDLLIELAKAGKSLEEARPNCPFRVEVEDEFFTVNGVKYFYSVDDLKHLVAIRDIFKENLPRLVPMALDQRYRQINTNLAYLKPFVDAETDFSNYKTRTQLISATLCGAEE